MSNSCLKLLRLSVATSDGGSLPPASVDVPCDGQVVVGRGADASVRLHSSRHPTMISRRHAILRSSGGSLFLIDLNVSSM